LFLLIIVGLKNCQNYSFYWGPSAKTIAMGILYLGNVDAISSNLELKY